MDTLLYIFLFLVSIFIFLISKRSSKRCPPGSRGLPFMGQSLGLLRAMKNNTTEKWLEDRVRKYGPVSKLSLFGKPAVFIYGQAANKLVFAGEGSTTGYHQPKSMIKIMGESSLLGLSGQDHKRVRHALMSILKPESLREYVGRIDEEMRNHLEMHWEGKQEVTVLPLMKTLTFNIVCSILIGLERGVRRDKFLDSFQEMIQGVWSVPINLPFTSYSRGIKASASIQNMVKDLIQEKREEFNQNGASRSRDLTACLLNIRDENNEPVLTDKEILHNLILVMIAGHDTSSILITFIIRLLANDPSVYAGVVQEQEEITKTKSKGEPLKWEDLAKMKYTWRVATETLRMFPPVFGGFRSALKEIEYEGYTIPKGWQIFWVSSMTHMDDRLFPEPTKFDPNRFRDQASIPPYSFIAFGAGPRLCPGIEFARMETLVAIHYITTRFTWKLCADNLFSRVPMPLPTKGLPIQIVPRNLL
ncbi:cytochrome P450 716B1-like [Tripterygium wilfordii]|uniref:cytochrome P450 716B1-like n=1 Tax=Tripterygium wilfordii TaxID=458696 RepID=UPI0018F82438|nr:cytochrome P450 716B1-like [Tripterygium wilfordii]